MQLCPWAPHPARVVIGSGPRTCPAQGGFSGGQVLLPTHCPWLDSQWEGVFLLSHAHG